MTQNNYFALTIVSEDRPGIVATVSRVLVENGFNIEDSSSTLLRGFFSMILIIRHGDDLDADAVKSMFAAAEAELGMTVSVRPIVELTPEESGEHYVISVYGSDKPGIVHNVAETLARHNINIIDLQTKVAGKDKTPVYIMVLEVIAPDDLDEDHWTDHLKEISRQIGTDIHIRHIETYEF